MVWGGGWGKWCGSRGWSRHDSSLSRNEAKNRLEPETTEAGRSQATSIILMWFYFPPSFPSFLLPSLHPELLSLRSNVNGAEIKIKMRRRGSARLINREVFDGGVVGLSTKPQKSSYRGYVYNIIASWTTIRYVFKSGVDPLDGGAEGDPTR